MVHTIKGTCGFLGLPRLEHVAHAAESVLGKVRDGAISVTPEMVSLVLMALDRVKAIIAGLGTDRRRAGRRRRATDRRVGSGRRRKAWRRPQARQLPQAAPRTCGTGGQEPVEEAPAEEEVVAAAHAPPSPASLPGRSPAPEPAAATTAPAATQTIRVTVDVLEDLMTLVSELVLTRNQLLQLARPRKTAASPRRCNGCRTSPPTCRKA